MRHRQDVADVHALTGTHWLVALCHDLIAGLTVAQHMFRRLLYGHVRLGERRLQIRIIARLLPTIPVVSEVQSAIASHYVDFISRDAIQNETANLISRPPGPVLLGNPTSAIPC